MDSRKGTTLLEIMIALFILATAMIPIASIMGYGGRATTKDARRIIAIQQLDKTLRRLLREPFPQIPLGANVQTGFNEVALGKITVEQGYSYNVSLKSEYVNPTVFTYQGVNVNRPTFKEDQPVAADFLAAENLTLNNVVLRLTVTVSWTEQGNLPVSVSAMTFRANLERRTG